MRIVIDAIPITGASTGIVTEHLIGSLAAMDAGDEITVVMGPDAGVTVPPEVRLHRVGRGLRARLWAQSVTLPRLCREVKADVVLGLIASTTLAPLPCPRCIFVHDMRHELRPEQFLARTLFFRQISYSLSYRQARGIACISARTKNDLLARHPRLEGTPVKVIHLGSDHTAGWSPGGDEEKYAIAFGQYTNKNVDLVLHAWARLKAAHEDMPLRIFGVPERHRATTDAMIDDLGLTSTVTTLPWLPADEFRAKFAGASLVVFPSDFEGFGLPAVEAMALGIPLIVSADPALMEVTGGHAVTVPELRPAALAEAVRKARTRSPEVLEAARQHAAGYTWMRSATHLRALLEEVVTGHPQPAPAPAPAPAISEAVR
jgi:glycosyltransferase involved in cell wall biosynthesis